MTPKATTNPEHPLPGRIWTSWLENARPHPGPTAVEIRKGTWLAAGQSQLRRSGIFVETSGSTRASTESIRINPPCLTQRAQRPRRNEPHRRIQTSHQTVTGARLNKHSIQLRLCGLCDLRVRRLPHRSGSSPVGAACSALCRSYGALEIPNLHSTKMPPLRG